MRTFPRGYAYDPSHGAPDCIDPQPKPIPKPRSGRLREAMLGFLIFASAWLAALALGLAIWWGVHAL